MIKRFSTAAVCLAASGGMALAQQPAANPSAANPAAATTGPVKGTVLVNHGTGFVRVPTDAPLAPGDRLMARPGGRTTIVYADGCIVNVKPGATVTVDTTSPCKNAPANTAENTPATGEGALGGAAVAGAGLAVSGTIAIIVLATTQNGGPNLGNGSPISP